MISAQEIDRTDELEGNNHFINVIQASLRAQTHLDLFLWLQGEFQEFLPHDIFLAVWGDESLDQLQIDVFSGLPSMRTSDVLERGIALLVKDFVSQWKRVDHNPFFVNKPGGFIVNSCKSDSPIDTCFGTMQSALAHGFRDLRGNHQCLYVAFSQNLLPTPSATKYLRLLMPHIDTAMRQLPPLSSNALKDVVVAPDFVSAEALLTPREREIMSWVGAGKTNEVIGVILNISPFTVKNHLKRIFQKLEVTNRAQAVSKL